MWSTLARRLLVRLAPRLAASAVAVRARRRSHRMVAQWRLRELNSRLMSRLGDTVLSGPFAGLRLSEMPRREHIGPFLLGTYEAELIPWWDEILQLQFAQIVDVGAKFGYYAVGLARRYPGAEVVAFDIDPWARRATREMARINDTPNVSVQSFCTPDWLDHELRPNALVVSDCEGYERTLFCDSNARNLGSSVILIEMHDELSPGVADAIVARLESSHRWERIESSSAAHPSPVPLDFLSGTEALSAASEIRPPQEWFLFFPIVPSQDTDP